MLPILELSSVRRQATPISIELYHQMGEHGPHGRGMELIRGVVLEKMPRSPLHVTLTNRLFKLASAAASGTAFCVRKEDPLTLLDSEPEPDVAVVNGTEDDYTQGHPTSARLTIEVAVTTEELDREKAGLYAEAGVEEYWLVLPERRAVEVHTIPRDGFYTRRQTFAGDEILACAVLPGLRVDLDLLFRSVAATPPGDRTFVV